MTSIKVFSFRSMAKVEMNERLSSIEAEIVAL